MEAEAQEGAMARWEARDASSFFPKVAVSQEFIIPN